MGAPDLNENSSPSKLLDLASTLCDFHLLVFLDTTQLLSSGDMKVLLRVVTSPSTVEDPKRLAKLFKTDGWQTLMTFAREAAPARPGSSVPATAGGFDADIPQDVLDRIAAEQAASREDTDSMANADVGVRVCPHCTFENPPGGSDCEVCGLPLV
jgi:nuclear protein localization family protein 4